jgi:serine protease Do
MNPGTSSSISIGYAVASVAGWLRQVTVRITGRHGSHGSGVIWMPEGLIVTNAHVASSPIHQVEFADGRRAQGSLVARDPRHDLAALAVDVPSLPSASVRSARDLRAGELVIAVGNPIDGEQAVSTGILHRPAGRRPFLFADIRLAPGNSGGPLADAQGNVIGINSAIVEGLGCAVTSDAVRDFLQTAGYATTLETKTYPRGSREAG